MSASEPFNQMTGVLEVWLANRPTSPPAVNVAPSGSWTLVGSTDGGQKVKHSGKLKYYRDDDHQAPVMARRPEEDLMVSFNLVGLTLENYARILHNVAQLVSVVGPPATRTMYAKRGAVPSEYAMYLRGTVMSPYGTFPGAYYFPRIVSDGEPEPSFAKDDRAALACQFTVLEDDTLPVAQRMGYLIVQTS